MGVAYPRFWYCCAAMSRLATTTRELVVLGAPASCRRASMAAEACRAGAIAERIQFVVVMDRSWQFDEGELRCQLGGEIGGD